MRAVTPCPQVCVKGRCQGVWFEQACHRMEPPSPPKPPKPPPGPKVIGPADCQIEVGVKESPFDPHNDTVVPIDGAVFDQTTGLEMLFDVNTRATRRMRHNADDFFEVFEQLEKQGVIPGACDERECGSSVLL